MTTENEERKLIPTPYHNPNFDVDDDTGEQEDAATDNMDPSSEKLEATPNEDRPDSPEEVTYKKRYDDIKRHYDETVPSLRKEVAELKDKLVTASNKAIRFPKTKEQIQEWANEYPDLYAHIVSISGMQAKSQRDEIEKQLDTLRGLQREVTRTTAEQRVLEKHPDFDVIKNDPKFHEWAQMQPNEIQGWIYDNMDASLAIKALTLYKTENGLTVSKKESKQDNAAAAAEVSVKSKAAEPKDQQKKVWKLSEIKAMNPSTFDRYEEEIDLAEREGRIENDL